MLYKILFHLFLFFLVLLSCKRENIRKAETYNGKDIARLRHFLQHRYTLSRVTLISAGTQRYDRCNEHCYFPKSQLFHRCGPCQNLQLLLLYLR